MATSNPPKDCLALIVEIDRVMQMIKVRPDVQQQVQELRSRGEGLHRAGRHPECLEPLAEAARILGAQ